MTKIADTVFEGLQAVEIATEALVCTIVTCCGPRIARLARPGGRNLLLWKPSTYTRGEWDLRGGHRVWATRPQADENEDTYATDNLPCTVERIADGVRVLGGENPVNRTRRGFEVTVTAPDSLRVDNILRNTGDMLYSGGIWALTCSVPVAKTQYVIPIGDGSSWDAFRMVYFRTWAGHGQGGFADDQIRVLPDRVLITPAGVENKRMIESAAGILAMSDPGEGLTFVKRSPLQAERAAAYPLGTNLAFYIGPDNFMVEMESMGPEATLKPGAELRHTEYWTLHGLAIDVEGGSLRGLLDR